MFREKIQHYTYRAKTAMEESLIDDEKHPHNLSNGELLNKIFSGKSKYEKILSFLRLAKNILPEKIANICSDKLKSGLYSEKPMPFNPEKYKFKEKIGKGGGCRVYLLESQIKDQPSWVAKILMPSAEGKTPTESLKNYRQDYEYIRNIYREIPEIILPEHFVIISDPFKKGVSAAAANLQPFMSGEIKDIFRFKPGELKDLSDKSPVFRNQLKKFCSISLENFHKDKKALDFLGEDNVVIVRNEEEEKLIVLDPHNIYSQNDPKENRRRRTMESLKFLKEVEAELTTDETE